MHKSNSKATWLSLSLDRTLRSSLQAQLCDEIRRLVHAGRLASGERLPASRTLAAELSVSRITVVGAYEQLVSEGYLVGRRGAGMFVAPDLTALSVPPTSQAVDWDVPDSAPLLPFDTAAPDMKNFPHRLWSRLLEQTWRRPDPALLARADPLGWAPLRVAIAQHLRDWRGIVCRPAQVVVTSGLGEAISLIARIAHSNGDGVAVEDPGHGALRAALRDNGLQDLPCRVDEDGFDPAQMPAQARAVVVTPSRQFPLGMTLPLARRLQLLQWAEQQGGWIIEDDYDGEYRYQGRPLPAMMSLDETGRVIYAGSFSKVMFHGLRLAYLVLPPDLVGGAREQLIQRGARASLVPQPALARFMQEGHFATHLRRMRRLYAQRQRALLNALETECGDLLEAENIPSGMHLVARLSPGLTARMRDVEAADRARATDVSARPLSGFFSGRPDRQGLVLGFAGFDETTLEQAAARLGNALR